MPVITNLQDMRELARRRIPRAIFDYIDRGSYDETTIRANADALDALRFRQRVLVDVSNRSLATTVLGEDIALPLVVAPTGTNGLVRGDGEILAARAAEAAGIPYCHAQMSVCSMEDVRAEVKNPFWFQLYVFRDRGISRMLLERAWATGTRTLVLTTDLQVMGQRHRDIKNGLSVPPKLTPATLFDILTKPSWTLGILRGKRRGFGNLAGHVGGADTTKTIAEWIATQFDPSLSWRDLDWIRQSWPGKIVLKGILDPDDARAAAEIGADAVVVSNHGGRQLEGAPAAIAALPAIVDAVGDRLEVLFDSGVRSGQDVLKALALGARACMIGKAYLYGLGAMGEDGVRLVIEMMRKELAFTMALTGLTDVRKASRDILWNPPAAPR